MPLTLKDDKGYLYYQTWNSIQNNKVPEKFHTSNKYTIHNIKLWLTLENIPLNLVSTVYKGTFEPLVWQCLNNSCGQIFEQPFSVVLQKHGCPYCKGHRVGSTNCLANTHPDLAKEWHPTKNGKLTPFDVTSGSHKMVWWQCEKGHEWKNEVHFRIRNGCPYCSGRYPTKENNLLKYYPKLCEEWNYNKNIKNPEEYLPFSTQKVWWKCHECGKEWIQKICYRTRNKSYGCLECNQSKGETKIREWLRLNNITYEVQKSFNNLLGTGGGFLSYDFYLPDYNLLIEYQGEQHEHFVNGIHKSKKDFERQKEHDKRKKEYALKNRFGFLEIWYYDYDNIENILCDYISKKGEIIVNQKEMLDLIIEYENTDRKVIKSNFKKVMKKYKFKPADIINLGLNKRNVYSWTNMKSNNIPMLTQALMISTTFNFDVRELLKDST